MIESKEWPVLTNKLTSSFAPKFQAMSARGKYPSNIFKTTEGNIYMEKLRERREEGHIHIYARAPIWVFVIKFVKKGESSMGPGIETIK
jgi:hypothetical protein